MGTSFADYCATQDARNTLQLKVREWTLMLCDALEHNFIETAIRRQKFAAANETGNREIMNKVCEKRIEEIRNGDHYKFTIEEGRKYLKIMQTVPLCLRHHPVQIAPEQSAIGLRCQRHTPLPV